MTSIRLERTLAWRELATAYRQGRDGGRGRWRKREMEEEREGGRERERDARAREKREKVGGMMGTGGIFHSPA